MRIMGRDLAYRWTTTSTVHRNPIVSSMFITLGIRVSASSSEGNSYEKKSGDFCQDVYKRFVFIKREHEAQQAVGSHKAKTKKRKQKITSRAKTAVHKTERTKLNILPVWNEAKVKNKHEVINEVQTVFTIHEPINKSTRPQEQFVITTSTIE